MKYGHDTSRKPTMDAGVVILLAGVQMVLQLRAALLASLQYRWRIASAAAKAMNSAKSILMGVLKKRHSSCWNCAWIQLLSFLPTLYDLP